MMMSQPSIEEVNKLLEQEDVDLVVEEKRFRPNIFIDGEFPAFAEDKWAFIKIGESVVFRNARVCDRCVFHHGGPLHGGQAPPGGAPQDPEEVSLCRRSWGEESLWNLSILGSLSFCGNCWKYQSWGHCVHSTDIGRGSQLLLICTTSCIAFTCQFIIKMWLYL